MHDKFPKKQHAPPSGSVVVVVVGIWTLVVLVVGIWTLVEVVSHEVSLQSCPTVNTPFSAQHVSNPRRTTHVPLGRQQAPEVESGPLQPIPG